MKPNLALITALLLAPLGELHAADASSSATRPNVLLIMADDLRDFGGAFTKEVVKTPNLDRLRARGTTFERAYVADAGDLVPEIPTRPAFDDIGPLLLSRM